ncbi:hypothetical protein Desaci_4088 [Desulfosporosinus acidiphilus SJ4]|uniref:Uncharacterized protein n=1 Tax=Desulfosporosinus acidiphilus (strain DSM 22704 / JCM 16185 / SJ4) TaxID=646529 RepID=I4DAX7_DESAJ|nr:hypothetical protein [Desulfosporosinus acidiphilus]AFM42951.1 hypothetical protein Desaci_4088 [Desulfosporosinus acidiphilus SJ4]
MSGTTNGNGYYNLAITPTNIGGPFSLTFAVTSSNGNFNTIQGSITVTNPIAVPVQDVLQGVTIAGQTGTMPNMSTANPNGMGVGRSQALTWWTGGGSTIFLKPQQGYYDGNDTWTYYNDPNLAPGNIKNGVSILGVTGTAQTLTINAGDAIASESTTVQQNTSSNWVQYQNMGFRINTPGTYRLKFDIYGPSGGTSAYGQVRVNGTTVGTTFKYVCSYPPSVWETMQEDITLNAGDYVTLWFYADPYVGYPNSEVRNFSLCYGVANASSLGSWQ